MGRLIFITGGARSGKSAFAERLAAQLAGDNVLFVATAEAGDEDMRRRIAAHRQGRPQAWKTEEAPRRVGRRLLQTPGSHSVVLIDCLTLLASNAVLSLGEEPDAHEAERLVLEEAAELIEASRAAAATMIVVSNEVGLGLVPPNKLGRVYRDVLGKANARLAAEAAEVYLLVAGLPIDVKKLAFRLE